MDRPTTLPVPPFSRSRSMSRSSNHSNPESSQGHATAVPQEPLLSSANTHERLSRSITPRAHTAMTLGNTDHHGQFSQALDQLEKTWYLEALFLLCSIVCALLIVTFLAVYDNTDINSWHFYFPISAVVSTLGTVFKSSLLMAVSSALAQGKWTWFLKRPGTLNTFQAMDAGSRDTGESFRLLWHMRGKHLVSAGALVIALGFTIEPFLQYAISDQGRLVDMESSNTTGMIASIARSRRLDGGTQLVSTYKNTYPKIYTIPYGAISASFYDALNAVSPDSVAWNASRVLGYQNATFVCMSGNCTWPEYASIAIRSTCFDISDHLKRTTLGDPDATTALAAEANTGLDKRASSSVQSSSMKSSQSLQSSAMWTDWTLEHLNLTLSNTNSNWRSANQFFVLKAAVKADPKRTIKFNASQTLLAAFTIIRTDDNHTVGSADWDAADASAMECGLELALNVYNSSVVNGVLLERMVASVSQKVPGSWLPRADQSNVLPDGLEADSGTLESNPIYHNTFLYRDDYALSPALLQKGEQDAFNITQKTLLSTIDFLTSLIKQDNDNATVKAFLYDQTALYTYGSPILQPLFSQTNVTTIFDTVAEIMTTSIRNLGRDPMSGTAKQWVRFYQVRWAFLALPLSLMIIGIVFFILSTGEAHNYHVPNWKANSIATMIHGPDELLRRHLRTQNHVHSLAVASETVARLVWTPEGYHLTAVDQSEPNISRPTTPIRDEEEYEMNALRPPTTPQTPGSNVALVDPQSSQEFSPKPEDIRSVSPVFSGPGWSEVSIDDPSPPLGSRRSV